MEHRWGRRIVVDVPIQMTVVGTPLKNAQLANLSITGASIIVHGSIRVLSRIKIVVESLMQLPDRELTLRAYVARNHAHGIGIEWCETASPAVAELLRSAGAPVSRRIARVHMIERDPRSVHLR